MLEYKGFKISGTSTRYTDPESSCHAKVTKNKADFWECGQSVAFNCANVSVIEARKEYEMKIKASKSWFDNHNGNCIWTSVLKDPRTKRWVFLTQVLWGDYEEFNPLFGELKSFTSGFMHRIELTSIRAI